MLRVCEVTSAQRASRLLRLAVSRVRSAGLSSDPSRRERCLPRQTAGRLAYLPGVARTREL